MDKQLKINKNERKRLLNECINTWDNEQIDSVKKAYCPYRGPEFDVYTHVGSSKPPVTPAPRRSHSSGLSGYLYSSAPLTK